jgi:hypothetical protein
MTGFGEKRPVGQDRIVLVVHRFLEEHVPVLRLAAQPGEQLRGRVERPPATIRLAVVLQVAERLVKYGQVTALGHRPEESRRPRSWCAPQGEHCHGRNLASLDLGRNAKSGAP